MGTKGELTQLSQQADSQGVARLNSWKPAPWSAPDGEEGWILPPGRSAESKPAGLWNVAMCILGLLGRAPGDRAVTVRITGVLNFPTGSSSPDLRPWEKRLPPPVPRPHVSQLASLSLSGLQAAAHWLIKMRLVRGSAH